jgi:sugar phosphate isomerase/epimerase
MKISMMTYTMARGRKADEKFDVKALCEFTRELKLEAVDWCGTYGHDPKEIRRTMDDFGLKTVCYTAGCDLNFPTAAERAPGRETFKKMMEIANILGADKIMLPVGGKRDIPREQSFRNYMSGLHEVIGVAEKAGVTVTVENFPSATSPFIVSADVNRAVAELPQLRTTFDNGNVTCGGEPAPDGFKNSAQWVIHSHFKDWTLVPEGSGLKCLDGKCRKGALVGDGTVDQIGCLRAMKEYGYKGYINFEYEGSDLTPRQATIEGVRRMREWMAAL